MDEIANPHDKLFRETWSDLATAKSFLHHYLLQEILTLTALDTLIKNTHLPTRGPTDPSWR